MFEEEIVRRKRLEAMRSRGIDPYPSSVTRNHTLHEVTVAFSELESSQASVSVVGRVRLIRTHGGLTFLQLQDESAVMQAALKRDVLGDDVYHAFLDSIDLGDFLQIEGVVFVTKKGEQTILVRSYRVLAKALYPLPEKWHGLTDTETRFRKRYLDLLMNQDVKHRMVMRSKIISAIRELLDTKGFLEVETPTLQPVYGGGFARPFVTHHNALDADFYLRISDEMYLKRLLVGGFEKVYEITKVFRNEGIDRDHNPEFTMFEAQIAYENYEYGMNVFEEIFEHAAQKALGTTRVQHGDTLIELKRPWKRMKLVEAVAEIGGLPQSTWRTVDGAKKALSEKISTKKQEEMSRMNTTGELLAFAFEELVEEQLIQPTIIYDYPVEVSPLAKKSKDPAFVERFEAFALGSEIGNNYSELNDPVDLEARFIEEKRKEEAGFDEAHQTDYDYLDAIKHGMPPACGLGIGIDRMVMLLTGADNIKEVILFPTLRPEKQVKKEVAQSDIFESIKARLHQRSVPYVTKHHGPKPEDSDEAMGFEPSKRPHHEGAKALIVKGKKTGNFFHFVLPDDCKIDQKKAEKVIGEKFSFASAEEVKSVTNCVPGSVPPFGSVLGLKTHMDIRLKENKEIFFNAGRLTDSIRIALSDFLRAEDVIEVDIV